MQVKPPNQKETRGERKKGEEWEEERKEGKRREERKEGKRGEERKEGKSRGVICSHSAGCGLSATPDPGI